MNTNDGTKRDANGQYSLAKLDHACICGHTLGQHSAVRIAKDKLHECFEDGCSCTFFTKVRASKVAR